MTQVDAGPAVLADVRSDDRRTPLTQGIELRHLRYFVAVADAGTFTEAAERIFIAQPTLSQQVRRLEDMVGAPLLQRRREGVQLTSAGSVLLEESRAVLALVDHGLSRTRQAAGLGRPGLRIVMPPGLPEVLAVTIASRLRSLAGAADVHLSWLETVLDAEFSAILQRRADAALGWIGTDETLPASLDTMTLGEFEPVVWLPTDHPAAEHASISLDELAAMDVIHGPRRLRPGVHDAWRTALCAARPRFEFTDPAFRRSLPMTLAFAASASRPTAVQTGPQYLAGPPGLVPGRREDTYGTVPVRPGQSQLTATAGLVWSADLPRPLQQVLFDAADSIGV